jgi:hypothetical protein
MAFEDQAGRLRRLARNPNVLIGWRSHAEDERKNDGIAKLDVHNMLKRCSVTNVEDTDGEEGWRAEGTDIDGRRIIAIVVAYEDEEFPEIKIITTWAKKST